jgi:hypothetical protein
VTLASSSTTATVPATVTVPAGSTSATFTVSTSTVSSNQAATITASYGGGSAQATLTVTASAGGGTLPQFTEIEITATFAGTTQTSGTHISINILSSDGIQECSVSGSAFASVTSYSEFGAAFTGFTANGLTLTCNGFNPTGSEIETSAGMAQFSSASLTVTLNPQVISTSGTVTGSINLVSTIATISGSFSGTFIAQ